jgi:hypothetical protein
MQIFLDRDHIRVIDGALDPQLCAEIIEQFERDHQRHHHDGDRYIELDIFTRSQKLWQPVRERWRELGSVLTDRVNEMVSLYRRDWDPYLSLPNQYAMEGMRVKAYRRGYHQFRTHVDIGNRDSSTRFLSFLFYLNDNTAGTEFLKPQLYVEARAGRCVIFPPNWLYPHRGLLPQDSDKYILSTYLHYEF